MSHTFVVPPDSRWRPPGAGSAGVPLRDRVARGRVGGASEVHPRAHFRKDPRIAVEDATLTCTVARWRSAVGTTCRTRPGTPFGIGVEGDPRRLVVRDPADVRLVHVHLDLERLKSAMVTTAPRVRPPPTEGATTSPTSASFRSTVPLNGARMYVFSRVASANRNDALCGVHPGAGRTGARLGLRRCGSARSRPPAPIPARGARRGSASCGCDSRAAWSRSVSVSVSVARACRDWRAPPPPRLGNRHSRAGRSPRPSHHRPAVHRERCEPPRHLGRNGGTGSRHDVPVGGHRRSPADPPEE